MVVAAGDISNCTGGADCATARTARVVRAIDPFRVLAIGDTQYSRGALSEYQAEYAKTWGQFKARTRPVPGNHEYLTPGASGYYNYFGKSAHRGHGGYYSYQIRRWHVVALNSSDGLCTNVPCGPGSKQLRWLKHDLHADNRSCVLAYWHHPPFSSGQPGGNRHVRPMWTALARNGADIVLNGHNHNYERFAPRNGVGRSAPNGVRQFIVGTGGTELRPRVGPWDRLSRERIGEHYGVLRLALRATSYKYSFVSATGAVLDSGGPISCK